MTHDEYPTTEDGDIDYDAMLEEMGYEYAGLYRTDERVIQFGHTRGDEAAVFPEEALFEPLARGVGVPIGELYDEYLRKGRIEPVEPAFLDETEVVVDRLALAEVLDYLLADIRSGLVDVPEEVVRAHQALETALE